MMKMKASLAGLMMACLATGCSKNVGRFNITLEADKDLKSSVTVDVVAVSESQYQTWYAIDMDKYANPNDDRKNAKAEGRMKSFDFDADHRSFTIAPTDPIYNTWTAIGGKPKLFIMANLPSDGTRPTGAGQMDFRRKILPLESAAWSDGQIKIVVKASGVFLVKEPESKYAVK